MTWVRLDDGFTEHPKVAALDAVEFSFHVHGIVYCGRNLTDGFVPRRVALTLMDLTGLANIGAPNPDSVGGALYEYTASDVIDDLVTAGVWDEVQGGYLIHDFLDYNPSRQQVEQERSKKQAAGRAGGRASAKARAQTSGAAGAQAESKPVPVPGPVPELQSQSPASSMRDDLEDPDLAYALGRLALRFESFEPTRLTASAVALLERKWTYPILVAAVRKLHGRPPDDIHDAFAYLAAMCRDEAALQAGAELRVVPE